MAATLLNREEFHTYAQETIEETLHIGLFDRPVLLAALGAMGEQGVPGGRPGGLGLISGGARLTESTKVSRNRSPQTHVRFLNGVVGGGKWMGKRDTTPTTGNDSQDQKPKTASFAWALRSEPIKVWKNAVRFHKGNPNAIADPLDEAVTQALEEHLQELATKIYTGDPTSQSEDVYDEPIGLQVACHASNTYGNVNRSTDTAWAGKRSTTAAAPTLDLVDDANLIQGASNRGPGVDLVITTNANYKVMKKEAIAKGGVLMHKGMADYGMVGFKREYIQYGDIKIIHDPYCPANALFALTTGSWVFETHPDENFRVVPFKDCSDDGEPGSDDAYTSKINTMMRLYTTDPWQNVQYTAIS